MSAAFGTFTLKLMLCLWYDHVDAFICVCSVRWKTELFWCLRHRKHEHRWRDTSV